MTSNFNIPSLPPTFDPHDIRSFVGDYIIVRNAVHRLGDVVETLVQQLQDLTKNNLPINIDGTNSNNLIEDGSSMHNSNDNNQQSNKFNRDCFDPVGHSHPHYSNAGTDAGAFGPPPSRHPHHSNVGAMSSLASASGPIESEDPFKRSPSHCSLSIRSESRGRDSERLRSDELISNRSPSPIRNRTNIEDSLVYDSVSYETRNNRPGQELCDGSVDIQHHLGRTVQTTTPSEQSYDHLLSSSLMTRVVEESISQATEHNTVATVSELSSVRSASDIELGHMTAITATVSNLSSLDSNGSLHLDDGHLLAENFTQSTLSDNYIASVLDPDSEMNPTVNLGVTRKDPDSNSNDIIASKITEPPVSTNESEELQSNYDFNDQIVTLPPTCRDIFTTPIDSEEVNQPPSSACVGKRSTTIIKLSTVGCNKLHSRQLKIKEFNSLIKSDCINQHSANLISVVLNYINQLMTDDVQSALMEFKQGTGRLFDQLDLSFPNSAKALRKYRRHCQKCFKELTVYFDSSNNFRKSYLLMRKELHDFLSIWLHPEDIQLVLSAYRSYCKDQDKRQMSPDGSDDESWNPQVMSRSDEETASSSSSMVIPTIQRRDIKLKSRIPG